MKRLLYLLIMCISLPAFAQTSDFEKGYREGKSNCNPAAEAWFCEITYIGTGSIQTSGLGRSREEAILTLDKRVLNNSINNPEYFPMKCNKL